MLFLQTPSSCCQWEKISQLQIMTKIQRLLRCFVTISTVFKLESEETEYLPATGLDICIYEQIHLYSVHYSLNMDKACSCFDRLFYSPTINTEVLVDKSYYIGINSISEPRWNRCHHTKYLFWEEEEGWRWFKYCSNMAEGGGQRAQN